MTEHTVLDAIGRTPLVRLGRWAPQVRLYAKLEVFNPGGSVKDRPALAMIRQAEKDGALTEGAVIVEATSGNTGIGLAVAAAALGYRLILTMPENMTPERIRLLRWLGAEVKLTPAKEGMSGAVWAAEQTAAMIGGILVRQFENPANPQAHQDSTAEEIWQQTAGEIDCLVLGVGTGGTLTGVGRTLRERRPTLRIVAVEPARSAVLSGGRPGVHRIDGLGAGFAPAVLDRSLIDRVVSVSDQDAVDTARQLARQEGILAGLSAGAAAWAARREALELSPGAVVVTVFPDSFERYLSVLDEDGA